MVVVSSVGIIAYIYNLQETIVRKHINKTTEYINTKFPCRSSCDPHTTLH
jgi:hypothetical protein